MRLLRADMLLASVMFQILMIEKIRFFFARYCSFYINNPLKLSRTAACYSLCAHVAESDQDIQNARQPSQTHSIHNKN
jgi:hypothetical protein